MNDSQLIALWNLLYPDNVQRLISPQKHREGLIALLNAISARIGSLPLLQTAAKNSIVAAINELVSRLEVIEDTLTPLYGTADPNVTQPAGFTGLIGQIYLQQTIVDGNVESIAYWIYTGVKDYEWAKLNPITGGSGSTNRHTYHTYSGNDTISLPSGATDVYWISINNTIFQKNADVGFTIGSGDITLTTNLAQTGDKIMIVSN